MNVFDGLTRKIIETKSGVKIRHIANPGKYDPKHGVYILFEHDNIPNYVFVEIKEDKSKQVERVVYFIQRCITKYEEKSKNKYEQKHLKSIADFLVVINDAQGNPSPVQKLLKMGNNIYIENFLKEYIGIYLEAEPSATYEDVYLYCVRSLARIKDEV